ncbi:MAG: hypothetical protein AB7R77_12615 [Ilumatobacteraceae bacterium]
MTQYASPAELAVYLQRELSTEEQNAAILMLDLVSGEIDEIVGYGVTSGPYTVTIPGTWSARLELPALAVASVSAVTVNGVALDASTWRFDGLRALLRYLPADELEAAADDLAAPGAGYRYGGNWGGPFSVIRITFTGGLNHVPATIRSIILQAVARSLSVTPGVRQEMLGSYQVMYDRPASGAILNDDDRKRIRRALGVPTSRTIEPVVVQ